MGRIATAIRDEHSKDAVKVSQGQTEEYLVTRHGQFEPALNIINLYGSQESRLTADQIKENWEAIIKELVDIESRNENCILIGDTNRHVGNKIPGNHDKTTLGGKLLIELLDGGKYALVNALDVCTGGPFTRYDSKDPSNDDKKSAIDLVVISSSLLPYVEKLEVDKQLKWTPYRVKRNSMKHPDHYALMLTLNNIPMRNKKFTPNLKRLIWNTKNKDGWKKYKSITGRDKKELTRVGGVSALFCIFCSIP